MNANVSCPEANCQGEPEDAAEPQVYRCKRCGLQLRQVVVANLDAFKRKAERETRTSRIAKAALARIESDS